MLLGFRGYLPWKSALLSLLISPIHDASLTSNSKDSLPYIDALTQELFRWEIIAAFGVPHQVTEDDEYRGE